MKKIALMVVCGLLAVTLATGSAWAKPGNGNGNGGNADRGKGKATVEQVSGVEKGSAALKEQKLNTYREKLRNHNQLMNGGSATRVMFKDTERHWAQKSIQDMAAIGLFSGYGDGTFKPNKPISQAEIIALLMRLTTPENTTGDVTVDGTLEESSTETGDAQDAVSEDTGDTVEDDTSADTEDGSDAVAGDTSAEQGDEIDEELAGVPGWARQSVGRAAQLGILNINRFHSQVQATRAQAAVWIAKTLGLEPVDVSGMPFVDGALISQEDAGYILALYEEGLISGMPGGKFNPNSAITRAEMAVLIERILTQQEEQPGDAEENTGEDNTTGGVEENTGEDNTTGDVEEGTGDGNATGDVEENTGDESTTGDAAVNTSDSNL